MFVLVIWIISSSFSITNSVAEKDSNNIFGTEINVMQHVITEVGFRNNITLFFKSLTKLILYCLGGFREKKFRTNSDTENFTKGKL
jgi:hypothetical protein